MKTNKRKTPTRKVAVTVSAQGAVVQIKCKQTGRVILKLKLRSNRQTLTNGYDAASHSERDYDLMIAMCDADTTYTWDSVALAAIAECESREV